MKISDNKEKDAYLRQTMIGALQGGLVGGSLAFGLNYLAIRRFPSYARLPIGVKSLFVAAGTFFSISVRAELLGTRYEKNLYAAPEHIKEKIHYDSFLEKARAEFNENKYSYVFGAWLAAVAGSGVYLWRDKLMTPAQKVVQARMYAQGLTVVLLLATLAVSVNPKDYNKK
ncbi:hypothetical protein CANCADRAFT_12258, partial [Tortispora caseinolytica NRRL Y-17796]